MVPAHEQALLVGWSIKWVWYLALVTRPLIAAIDAILELEPIFLGFAHSQPHANQFGGPRWAWGAYPCSVCGDSRRCSRVRITQFQTNQ